MLHENERFICTRPPNHTPSTFPLEPTRTEPFHAYTRNQTRSVENDGLPELVRPIEGWRSAGNQEAQNRLNLEQHLPRVLNELLDLYQERHSLPTVQKSMVICEGEIHHLEYDQY